MKTPSTESFHSTRSRPPSISGSPPPPETVSHMNPKPGVSLTTTLTTHNVGHLNNLCQTLGLSARYEIDGDQPTGFGGYLQLGPHTITRDERWPSKKAAREGLAQKGLAILRDLQRKKAEEEESVGNWVGMLHSKRGNFRNQCYSISLCSDLCRHTQSSHLVFFLLALSRLPPKLWSIRRQYWPYLHWIHHWFPVCLHLPHLPPPYPLWFRISSLPQQESCENECGAGSDGVSYFVGLRHIRWEARPEYSAKEVSYARSKYTKENRDEIG